MSVHSNIPVIRGREPALASVPAPAQTPALALAREQAQEEDREPLPQNGRDVRRENNKLANIELEAENSDHSNHQHRTMRIPCIMIALPAATAVPVVDHHLLLHRLHLQDRCKKECHQRLVNRDDESEKIKKREKGNTAMMLLMTLCMKRTYHPLTIPMRWIGINRFLICDTNL
jgi:hypothetical protein